MFHFLSSLIFLILWYISLMNNGQMDRGNENPTQHLLWWLRKTTKKPQSGWLAPGFEPGTSQMRVSCVTTEPCLSLIISFDVLRCYWSGGVSIWHGNVLRGNYSHVKSVLFSLSNIVIHHQNYKEFTNFTTLPKLNAYVHSPILPQDYFSDHKFLLYNFLDYISSSL